MPPILTHGGVIKDYIAGEDIKNNDIYIVDTETQKSQVVYVYETNPWAIDGIEEGYIISQKMIDSGTIKEGTRCRCWLGFFRV